MNRLHEIQRKLKQLEDLAAASNFRGYVFTLTLLAEDVRAYNRTNKLPLQLQWRFYEDSKDSVNFNTITDFPERLHREIERINNMK